MTSHSVHQFADATIAQIPGLRSDDCELIIKQQPDNARVAVGKEKDRKPVDPPPIIQLKLHPHVDPLQNYLQSPYFFMSCTLVGTTEGSTPATLGASLAGTVVSSLHRLKDTNNHDGAFFVFGDLSVKIEGKFRLQFNLYEMRHDECFHVHSIRSELFTVHPTKHFPGMSESTFLTRSFSDQGVRLRLRKEPRTLLRKRGPASEDYVPRHYNKSGIRSSQGDQSARGEGSPQSQSEQQGSMYSQPHSPFDPRSQMGRGYSQHSSDSFSPGFTDEPNIKRPRTGSEHSQPQSFGHPQHPPESPQYGPPRLHTDVHHSQWSAFGQPQPQQQAFGYNYVQSPQAATPRDQYTVPRFPNTQQGSTAYNPMSQRPPQAFYPSAQPPFQSTPQYGMAQMGIGLPTPPTPPNASMGNFGMMDRSQISPAMAAPTVAGHDFGRAAIPSGYAPIGGPADMYQSQGGGPSMMSGTSGMPISTTSGPGNLPHYQ